MHSEDDTFNVLKRTRLAEIEKILSNMDSLEFTQLVQNDNYYEAFLSKHGWTRKEFEISILD